MPTVITKKSTVVGKVPLDTDLQVGELAVNTADKILYSKHSDNQVVKIGFDPAVPGAIGETTPDTIKATKATVVSGTVTSSVPAVNVTQTWNNAAVPFTGKVTNITNTASNSASLIDDLQVNSSQVFGVRVDGGFGRPGTAYFKYVSNIVSLQGIGFFRTTEANPRWVLHTDGAVFNNESGPRWVTQSSTIGTVSAYSAGMGLSADGVVDVNNGRAISIGGAYRDLKLRNQITTGSISAGLSAKTADYTLTANDGTITADSTSAAITLTLETAVGHTRIHAFKKVAGVNLVTIDGNASETIDGATSITLTDRCILQSNGTEWKQIA